MAQRVAPPMATDLGIIHSATMWLELHGDNAISDARRMAAEIRGKGDLDGADQWLKIIVALEDLRNASTRAGS
jgi:hypothetical protein